MADGRDPSFMVDWDFDCPYIEETYEYTNDTIVFNGYFRLESKTLPVRRILATKNKYFWIEIVTKEEIKNTSEYSYDDEFEANICLTPTAKIRITYKILKELNTLQEIDQALKERHDEKENEKLRNDKYRLEREKEQMIKDQEIAKNLRYFTNYISTSR